MKNIDFNINDFKDINDEINKSLNKEINILEKNINDMNEINNIIKEILYDNSDKINEIEKINNNIDKIIDNGNKKLILSKKNNYKYTINKIYSYFILIITFPFFIKNFFH